MILSGCLFLVYFCSCTVHSQTRASVLYCLLSQTDRSLDSQTRATALHRLLSQAVCSLMTQEKQMPPSASLVLPCAHRPPMIPIKIFSSVIGSSLILTPTALYTAFAIAGDGVLITISPMDFAPNGPVGS